MDIETSIEIKKQRLARELDRKKPNWIIVNRLEEKIRHHAQEILNRKRSIRRNREFQNKHNRRLPF